MQGLGLNTRPTGQRPSGYGLSASKLPIPASGRSHRQHEKLPPDTYPMGSAVQTQHSDIEAAVQIDDSAKSSSWFTGSFGRPAPKDGKKFEKRETDNESERSLRIKSERNSEDGMQIMVSKSFYMTDEERGSRSSGDGPQR